MPEQAQSQKKKGLAIASLICGIIGGSPAASTLSIPAIICGHIALSKSKLQPDTYGGRGMAIAGVVLGYLWAFRALRHFQAIN